MFSRFSEKEKFSHIWLIFNLLRKLRFLRYNRKENPHCKGLQKGVTFLFK